MRFCLRSRQLSVQCVTTLSTGGGEPSVKKDFETEHSGVFAAPGLPLAHFSTAEFGLICEARIVDAPPDPSRVKTYLRKYREGIKEMGMTAQEFSASYSVPIIVIPLSMRGFVE